MALYTIGSVPYLNAKPLVKPLIWEGDSSPVKVEFAVPSKLPEMLLSGKTQAIMVSSISAITDPRATIADGLSISSQRAVRSVRLFSKVPFHQITNLAEDQSSMTSNALAKILLAESYDVRPKALPMPPQGEQMLSQCDACLLIGDPGMSFDGAGLHVMDLGEAWRELTGLPFVWAVWMGDQGLTSELVGYLQEALESSWRHIDRVIEESSLETGFTLEQCRSYFMETMDYRLGEEHIAGLRAFGARLKAHRLVTEVFEPKLVKPGRPLAMKRV